MDDVASEVHGLVRNLCQGDLSESEFTARLRDVQQRHPNPGNIGRAIDKGLRMANPDESEEKRVWRLTESVDSQIKADYEGWTDAEDWDIG